MPLPLSLGCAISLRSPEFTLFPSLRPSRATVTLQAYNGHKNWHRPEMFLASAVQFRQRPGAGFRRARAVLGALRPCRFRLSCGLLVFHSLNLAPKYVTQLHSFEDSCAARRIAPSKSPTSNGLDIKSTAPPARARCRISSPWCSTRPFSTRPRIRSEGNVARCQLVDIHLAHDGLFLNTRTSFNGPIGEFPLTSCRAFPFWGISISSAGTFAI